MLINFWKFYQKKEKLNLKFVFFALFSNISAPISVLACGGSREDGRWSQSREQPMTKSGLAHRKAKVSSALKTVSFVLPFWHGEWKRSSSQHSKIVLIFFSLSSLWVMVELWWRLSRTSHEWMEIFGNT